VNDKEMDWKTAGFIIGPGVVTFEETFYKSKDSNVEIYGFRWALCHEVVDGYFEKHTFEEVRRLNEDKSIHPQVGLEAKALLAFAFLTHSLSRVEQL